MEQRKLKGIKTYNIDVDEDIHIYQAYANCVNWLLNDNKLTSSELEIMSYFMYYNNKYKTIEDIEVRGELLFSLNTRKKIREALTMNSPRFDNYLKSIKSKGVIQNDRIADIFIFYPETMSSLLFSFSIKKGPEPVKYEEVQEIKFEPIPETITTTPDFDAPEGYVTLDDLYYEDTKDYD